MISGRVTDPTQAVVPDAKVTLTNLATNVARSATTNAEGIYFFANLSAGDYDISVEKRGFRKIEQRAVLEVAQRLGMDFTLEVGSMTQVVTVAEKTVAVNTQSGDLSFSITPAQVMDLPLVTRNVYSLLGSASGAADTGSVTGDTRGLGLAVNGQRTSDINFMLDGGENNDAFVAGVGQSVPLDAVQELRVETNNMTAEFGRNAIVVNAITKGGGNAFHGSAWEYYRGAALSSTPFDDNASGVAKSNFVRNQFGFSAGGPIRKDKTFFFGSMEAIRVRSSGTVHYFVPTQDFYNASSDYTKNFIDTFGGLPTANTSMCMTADDFVTLEDWGTPLVDANTGLAIPGSTNLFCRTSLKGPIDAGGGTEQNNWNYTGRIDHHISDRTSLMGRYAFSQIRYPEGAISLSPYQGFNTGENVRNQNLNLTLTHTFTPSFYSESRVVYNRMFDLQPLGKAPSTTPCWQYDYFSSTPTGDGITFPGYVPQVCSFAGIPYGGPQNVYQGYQGFTWSRGKHTFKWGGQYVHMRDNRSFGAYENGYMDTFDMQGMIDGQTDEIVLAIDPKGKVPGDTYSVATDGPFGPPSFTRHFHYNEFAWYVEDSIKVTPRFTLTAGLRWEYDGVLHSPANEKNLDANLYLSAVGSSDVNESIYEQVRDARFRRTNHIYRSDFNNYAPRLGFAYDLFGNGHSVLRGGYGIFYERNFGNALFNVIQNPPNYMAAVLVPLGSLGGDNAPIMPNQFDTLSLLSGASTTLSGSARMMNPDMDTAYSPQWNATLEHNFFGKDVVGSISYVGASGIKLYSLNNLNQRGSCLLAPDINPVCDPSAGRTSRLNQTGLTGMNRRGNEGLSRYNGMSLSLRTPRLGKTGLLLSTSYTWAHSIDNESSFFADSPFEADFGFGFRNGFTPAADRASSTNDIRHRYGLSYDWQVPMGRQMTGVGGQTLGGWSLTGIFTAQTGGAFSVYDGSTSSQCNNDGTNFCYPILVGSVPKMTATPDPVFPNSFTLYNIGSAFETQQAYCGGGSDSTELACSADLNILHSNMLSGRNLFRTPGYYNWDLGLLKDFKLPRESMKLQFRAEFFDILNHSNLYAYPYTNVFSGSSSTVVATRGLPPGGGKERRNIQLALRFVW
jgi:outer membrane receptor protein involved in Fe transport